jgi:hypothetical protein
MRRSAVTCRGAVSRFASLAETAIVTARQLPLVDKAGLSIRSNSSSQSSAASFASSDPYRCVTARRNADNSRPAICIWSAQLESQNCSQLFIESASIFVPAPQTPQFNVVKHLPTSMAMPQGDQTRRLGSAQLDHGIDRVPGSPDEVSMAGVD